MKKTFLNSNIPRALDKDEKLPLLIPLNWTIIILLSIYHDESTRG